MKRNDFFEGRNIRYGSVALDHWEFREIHSPSDLTLGMVGKTAEF
jgi:hypothetical protein